MANKNKVDYDLIYDYLSTTTTKTITASMLAYKIGVERIYGGTMTKLVRDGALTKYELKGYYINNLRREKD